jgi:riboflavin synthase
VFTGLIERTGRIEGLQHLSSGGGRLHLKTDLTSIRRGDSLAVNGVCLTALPMDHGVIEADLSQETLRRTTLGTMEAGTEVNLELPLALGDRLGGHLVQGHVDATGELLSIEREGSFAVFRWSFPPAHGDLIVDKGSIAVDGISLTIVEPDDSSFSVAVIPETLAKTNLGSAAAGQRANLEFDIMAKHARHLFLRYLEHRA